MPQPVIKQLNHFATNRQTASSLPCPQPLLQLTECHWPSAKLPVDASLFSCPLKENTTSTLPFRSCTAKYTVWSALVSRPNRPSSKKVRNSNVMLKLREKKEKEAKVYCTLSLHHTCSSQRCILALSFKQQVTEPMQIVPEHSCSIQDLPKLTTLGVAANLSIARPTSPQTTHHTGSHC